LEKNLHRSIVYMHVMCPCCFCMRPCRQYCFAVIGVFHRLHRGRIILLFLLWWSMMLGCVLAQSVVGLRVCDASLLLLRAPASMVLYCCSSVVDVFHLPHRGRVVLRIALALSYVLEYDTLLCPRHLLGFVLRSDAVLLLFQRGAYAEVSRAIIGGD
jgi:hypothetical protein